MTNAHVSEGNNTADLSGSCLTVVFIDCTWYQVHKIATDPRLSSKSTTLYCDSKNQTAVTFLPHKLCLAWYMLWPCVCVSVCLSMTASVTSRCSKTAKHRNMQMMLHNSPRDSIFVVQTFLGKFEWVHPQRGHQMQVQYDDLTNNVYVRCVRSQCKSQWERRNFAPQPSQSPEPISVLLHMYHYIPQFCLNRLGCYASVHA